MSRIWITSDWHLNHRAILDFEGREPWYEKEIIRKINNQVKKEDILINLGDVIFDRFSELSFYMEQIKCDTKILVRGNHDKASFDSLINKWFTFVCDEFKLHYQQYRIIFSHKPLEEVPEGWINIHWHLHSWYHRGDKGNILYNPEKSGYNFAPVLLSNIIKNGEKSKNST